MSTSASGTGGDGDEAGATAIEYTMMVGFISFAIITSLTAIGRVIDEEVFSVIVAAAAAM